jgi:ATP-dependent Lhr-like helicase
VQDEGLSERKSRLRDDLIHELVSTPGLRPTVSRKIVDRFELKRKRQSKGYSPVFLATVQGTVEPEGRIDRLYNCLEQMICYPAPAELWESEIFPARMDPDDTSWMDTAMQQGHLLWVGAPNRNILFCFEPDLDLVRQDTRNSALQNACFNNESSNCFSEKKGVRVNTDEVIDTLFPDKKGKYSFSSLLEYSGENPSSLMEKLWNGVWQGGVGNDTFITLRKGIENRFKIPDGIVKNAKTYSVRPRPHGRRPGGRSGFSRWKAALPFAGNWHIIDFPESDDDLIEGEEKKKDRVRLLLERYGILFKELLHKELPSFQWRNIFRSLRMMELSGEILSGYFFAGIPGPQFISHRGFHILRHHLKESNVFWISAMDPSSLCGMPLDSIKGMLLRRLAGTHLVYRGHKVVLISQRNGKKLTFNVAADDPQIQEYLIVFRHLLTRRFRPLRQITVETINEEDASRSPFVDVLRVSFDVLVDYKPLVLYRKA